MEVKDLVSLTVTIAGRTYPLKVKESEEEMIRAVAKQVNDKILDFKMSYPKQDEKDLLLMTMLTYAVDIHKVQNLASKTETETPAIPVSNNNTPPAPQPTVADNSFFLDLQERLVSVNERLHSILVQE